MSEELNYQFYPENLDIYDKIELTLEMIIRFGPRAE